MSALMLNKSRVLSASTRCTMSFWEKKNGFISRMKYSARSGSRILRSLKKSSKSDTIVKVKERNRKSSPVKKPSYSDTISKEQRDRRISPLYTHPRLVQMTNAKIANHAQNQIYKFLRGIGIVPDELDELELPVTVDVMRERIDFLHELGLLIKDINNYPLVLGCSVKKNMIPVLDYLGTLGVKETQITDFLRRCPQVLHSSVEMDLKPVVKYLQGMGIKPVDIYHVLVRYPEVLGFKLEGTMSTSVAYLVGIGVSRRRIGVVYTRHPEILGMRVGTVIKPFVEYLESLCIPKLVTARMIENFPHILGFGLNETVKPNVESLLAYKVKETSIPFVIASYPEILGIDNLDTKLNDQNKYLDSLLGLNAEDFARVVERMPQIVSLSNSATIEHVNFLQQCGFSTEQVSKMVVKCPQLLALNLDIMGESLDYFKNTMNRRLDELVDFPAFFTYNLESTVKPRYDMIRKRGVECSIPWLLSCADEKFDERMSYELIDVESMEGETSSFDMNSLMEPRTDESGLDSEEEDDEPVSYSKEEDDESASYSKEEDDDSDGRYYE